MSTYPTTPAHGGQTMAAPAKPGTLLAALGATALAGLLAVVNGAYVLITGADQVAARMLANVAAAVTGQDADALLVEKSAKAAGGIVGSMLTDQIQGRAYIVLVPGLLVLVFGLLMGKASTGIRVTATIFAVITAAASGYFAADYGSAAPGLMAITGWGAAVMAIVAIVLMWLPANGSYAKALKQRA